MQDNAMVGVMFDPARLLFRKEWYFKLLPYLADWGYNTVMLNLADDVSCTIELHRHPQLASAHAFSQDEMHRFVKAAGRRGIQVIPFMPSLGHTGYIYWRSAFKHLRNGQGRSHLCLSNPETYRLLTDIWEELTDLFPAPWAHVGLDEFGQVPDPACAPCVKQFANTPKWQVYVRHVTWLRDLLAARGKRIMIWNEFPEGNWKQTELAGALPKDIVLTLEWDLPDKTRFYLEQGFDIIGAFPYLTSYPGTTILPNYEQNMTHQPWSVDEERYRKQILGKLVPVWQDTYNLFGATSYGIAHAADQIRIPGGTPTFGKTFCERYFGVKDGKILAGLLDELHRHAPQFKVFSGLNNYYLEIVMRDGRLINLFNHNEANQITAAEIAHGLDLARHAAAIGAGLRQERRQVTRNKKIYDVYLLAADLIRHIGGRGELMQTVSSGLEAARQALAGGNRRQARRLHVGIRDALRRAARESRELLERVEQNWDLGYYPDHINRHPVPYAEGADKGLLVDVADSAREFGVDIDRLVYFDGGANHIYASVALSTQYLERLARQAEGLVEGKRTIAGLGPIPCRVPPKPAVTAFVTQWRISAPASAPESLKALAFPKNLALQPRAFDKGWCDFREDLFASPEDRLVYLACLVECPEAMALSLGLGYDGPVKLWLDGKELFCDPAGTVPIGTDKALIAIDGAIGQHEILIALTSNRGKTWGLRLRFHRRDVTPEQLEQGPGAYLLPRLIG